MTGSPNPERRDRALAQLHRDAALSRVGRTRRFMIAGAAALTAGIAALASAVAPGRSLSAKRSVLATAPVTASGAGQALPPLASSSQLGLQPPSQAPQAPQSQGSGSAPDPSQAAPDPSQAAPAPAPAPSGGGAAVSGGS